MNDLHTEKAEEVTLKEWIVTLLITVIPVVNVIMYFVWAFSENTKSSKANWAKATIILFAALVAIYILVFVVIMGIGFY